MFNSAFNTSPTSFANVLGQFQLQLMSPSSQETLQMTLNSSGPNCVPLRTRVDYN